MRYEMDDIVFQSQQTIFHRCVPLSGAITSAVLHQAVKMIEIRNTYSARDDNTRNAGEREKCEKYII